MVDACAFAGIRRLAVALPGGCGQTGNVTAPSDRLQRGAQLRQPRPPGDVTGCRHVQPDPSAPLQDAGRGGVCRVRVAARDRSRAEQFAARFGIATAYGDYAEMVAAPDVDIVYVGTITCWGGEGGVDTNVKFRLRADLDQWLAEHGITTRRAAGAPSPLPNSSGKGCWRSRLRRAESAPELPRDFHHKGSTVLDTWFNMHVLADVGVEAVLDSARVVNTEQSFSAFQQSPDVHGAGCDELQTATVSCVGAFA